MRLFSMKGYFEHIEDKTYIDRYPREIIDLDDLKDAVIVEFGCGTGNDMRFLIERLGANPRNLFLVEADIYYFVDAMDKLEELFGDSYDDIHFWAYGVENLSEKGFPTDFADFVYANNFLHTLGYKSWEEKIFGNKILPADKIRTVFSEAYRILRANGVFFGRTLSDCIDANKLKRLKLKPDKSEKEEFVLRTSEELQRGNLVGLSEYELVAYAHATGFARYHTQMKDAPPWYPISDVYFRFHK